MRTFSLLLDVTEIRIFPTVHAKKPISLVVVELFDIFCGRARGCVQSQREQSVIVSRPCGLVSPIFNASCRTCMGLVPSTWKKKLMFTRR